MLNLLPCCSVTSRSYHLDSPNRLCTYTVSHINLPSFLSPSLPSSLLPFLPSFLHFYLLIFRWGSQYDTLAGLELSM